MSDERTADEAKKPSKIPPEVHAEVRSHLGKIEGGKSGDLSPVPRKEAGEPAGRDKHRHILDAKQENLVAPPVAGFGGKEAGTEQPTAGQKPNEAAKAAEKSVEGKGQVTNASRPTPAELAARLRGQTQQAQTKPEQAKGEQKIGPARATPRPSSQGGRGGPGD